MSGRELDGHRTRVRVADPAPLSGYDVWIRPGLLDFSGAYIAEACPAHRYAVVTDSQVAELYGKRFLDGLSGAGLAATLFKFPAGEWNKTREIWAGISDGLLKAGFGRDAAVIALGGGVTGDLAGFVAATYMRGLPVIQVPTTLLAMVDNSVGGKTGVDTPAGKNLIGAFHQPGVVLIDPAVLRTVPDAQFAAGLAEAFKHGLILDREYFEMLSARLDEIFARSPELMAEVIRRSVEIKAEVVQQDARETGYRRILNFGHTVAHAQETISGYGWLHGEAVAMGMVAEAAIGEAIGVTRPGVSKRIREVLEAARLPVEIDPEVKPDRFFEVLETDKKRAGGRTRYSLIGDVGRVAGSAEGGWTHDVPEDVVRAQLFG